MSLANSWCLFAAICCIAPSACSPPPAMLYLVRFGASWIKFGHTNNFWLRAERFWTAVHPKALCGQLGADNVELLALFAGGRAEERELFARFPPDCGEFFEAGRLEEIMQYATASFAPLPAPERPAEFGAVAEKLPCCGGKEYECRRCGMKFARACKLAQHLDAHAKVKAKCACGALVVPRNLKRHRAVCGR